MTAYCILCGSQHRYPLLLAALIAAKLLLPLIATLLPAAAVAALTGNGGMGQYLAVIGGLILLYAAGTLLWKVYHILNKKTNPCANCRNSGTDSIYALCMGISTKAAGPLWQICRVRFGD